VKNESDSNIVLNSKYSKMGGNLSLLYIPQHYFVVELTYIQI